MTMLSQVQRDIRNYYKGEVITHSLEIRVGKNLKSPTAISCYLVDPAGVQTGPFTPTKDGEGRYHYDQATTVATVTGTWTIKWTGTGVAQGSIERQVYVLASSFV